MALSKGLSLLQWIFPERFGGMFQRMLAFVNSGVQSVGPPEDDTAVCERIIPTDCGEISFESTESGAGEQFLPLDCKAKAHVIKKE